MMNSGIIQVKVLLNLILKFFLASVLGASFYVISLFISFSRNNMTFGGHRGFSPEAIGASFSSFRGVANEIMRTYRDFISSFTGSLYIVVGPLFWAYVVLFIVVTIFLCYIIYKYEIYKNLFQLMLIILFISISPFILNFTGFLATSTVETMIYPFVLLLVAVVILVDKHGKQIPLLSSSLIILMFFISSNFIIINNAFYLQAFFFNQRLNSLTIRIANQIDPLIPLIESEERVWFTYFGNIIDNEYSFNDASLFDEHGVRGGEQLVDVP